jgi:hypothetical protein
MPEKKAVSGPQGNGARALLIAPWAVSTARRWAGRWDWIIALSIGFAIAAIYVRWGIYCLSGQ